MVAVLPAQIASTHGNQGGFLIGCAGAIEDGSSCLTAYATSFYSTRSDLASGANSLGEQRAPIESPRSNGSKKRMTRETAETCAAARPCGGFVRRVEEPTRLGCVDGTAYEVYPFDDSENAVLLDSIASSPDFTTEERQDRRENGGRERLEQLSHCSALRALRTRRCESAPFGLPAPIQRRSGKIAKF
jgi:hypothetical protein